MDSVNPITHHAELIERLGAVLPNELDRLALPKAMGVTPTAAQEISFSFTYRDVPFEGKVVRRDRDAILQLIGDLGVVPYSIQAAQRRRRALRTIAIAAGETGLDWRLTEKQGITLRGDAVLQRPLTPSVMVVGAIGIVMRSEPYLKLLLDVLGAADYLAASEAA